MRCVLNSEKSKALYGRRVNPGHLHFRISSTQNEQEKASKLIKPLILIRQFRKGVKHLELCQAIESTNVSSIQMCSDYFKNNDIDK